MRLVRLSSSEVASNSICWLLWHFCDHEKVQRQNLLSPGLCFFWWMHAELILIWQRALKHEWSHLFFPPSLNLTDQQWLLHCDQTRSRSNGGLCFVCCRIERGASQTQGSSTRKNSTTVICTQAGITYKNRCYSSKLEHFHVLHGYKTVPHFLLRWSSKKTPKTFYYRLHDRGLRLESSHAHGVWSHASCLHCRHPLTQPSKCATRINCTYCGALERMLDSESVHAFTDLHRLHASADCM